MKYTFVGITDNAMYHRNNLATELKAITEEVRSIQKFGNDLTLFEHDPTGLGAQISRRILALKIGFITKRKSVFLNESMYPYELCYEPISDIKDSDILNLKIIEFDINKDIAKEVMRFDFWKFWDDESLRNFVYHYVPSCISEADELIFQGLLLSEMKLLPKYSEYVEYYKNKLNLKKPYIAVHYRRGDKKVETPYISAKIYRNAILKQVEATGIKRIFVASDSSEVLRDLNLNSLGFEIIFDADEPRYNNANHKYLMNNQDKSEEETLTAIKNIYILIDAEKIIGQDNAHFATLAAAAISYRNGICSYGELLDSSSYKKNIFTKFFYDAKDNCKAIVKYVFPNLTIKRKKK